MPSAKRNKSTIAVASQLTASRQSDIRQFSRVGKAGISATIVEKKRCCDSQTVEVTRVQCVEQRENCGKSRKRRRSSEVGTGSDEEEQSQSGQPERKRSKQEDTAQWCSSYVSQLSTSKKASLEPTQLPTPETTPTKPARFHDVIALKTPSKNPQSHTPALDTPPSTPRSTERRREPEKDSGDLPDEIQDLIQLHTSFLKAISLHFAHHGTAEPINIQAFIPLVSKIWSRRAVTELDIRRTLGIMQAGKSPKQLSDESNNHLTLTLYDYGRGRLCMERSNVQEEQLVIARHIEEDLLHGMFQDEIQKAWSFWTHEHSSDDDNEISVTAFINQLPLIPIIPHPSLSKVAPLFTEGLRRLSSIKSIAAASAKQTPSTSKKPSRNATSTAVGLKSRNQSLLDRVRAKEADIATLPAPPTKEALERIAALYRLPAVIAMLTLLSCATTTEQTSTSKRQTFSMQSLVQRIQDSSRSALSREEVETCLRLLAEEIAQGWVKIVSTVGSVLGVVIDGGARPSDEVLERRRKEALML